MEREQLKDTFTTQGKVEAWGRLDSRETLSHRCQDDEFRFTLQQR